VDQPHFLGLDPALGQGAEDLGEPLRQVDEVESPAVAKEIIGRAGEVFKGEGQLVPGQGALGFGADPAPSGRTKGGIGDDPVKLAAGQKVGCQAHVAFKDGAAAFQIVAAGVLAGAGGQLRLKLYAPEFEGRPELGEEKADDAAAGPEIDDLFAETGPDKRGEEKRVETVAIPLAGLGKGEAPYPFEGFFSSIFGRILFGGGSTSHNPIQ